MPATSAVDWIDASVTEVRSAGGEDIMRRKYVMILAERDGDRELPIWIGPAEATALALSLESAEVPRPFTCKLAAGLVAAAGSAISEVRITRLLAPVFYASVIVQGPNGPQEVDSRPSDAVNLALVTGVPIRIDSELFSVVTPADCAEEISSFPVTTAEIAAEAQQRIRELAQGVPGA